MKDIKCGLKECRFNKGYSCCANCISITDSTACKSYDPDLSKRSSMFEAGEEFTPANYSVNTAVKCGANCAFNKDHICYANGITVMNDSTNADASCLTFIKK